MNIRISDEALTGTTDNLLWQGALYGLKYLQQLDHQITFEGQALSEGQRRLLVNEKITSDPFDLESVELSVHAEKNQLIASADGEELIAADNWITLSRQICFPNRTASCRR